MAKLHDTIDDRITAFIEAQKMFFVGTAPSGSEGHVNLSPKGYDSFRILGPNKVAYLDLGGSGIETLAHVRENGRITFMFCAFDGKPNILRLYGKAEAVSFNEPGFDEKLALFPDFPKARSIFTADITRIQDSCGWGVPFYDFKSARDQLVRVNAHRTAEDWEDRRFASNSRSIDGLPGLIKPETDQ
jgi:hypothetical protein